MSTAGQTISQCCTSNVFAIVLNRFIYLLYSAIGLQINDSFIKQGHGHSVDQAARRRPHTLLAQRSPIWGFGQKAVLYVTASFHSQPMCF